MAARLGLPTDAAPPSAEPEVAGAVAFPLDPSARSPRSRRRTAGRRVALAAGPVAAPRGDRGGGGGGGEDRRAGARRRGRADRRRDRPRSLRGAHECVQGTRHTWPHHWHHPPPFQVQMEALSRLGGLRLRRATLVEADLLGAEAEGPEGEPRGGAREGDRRQVRHLGGRSRTSSPRVALPPLTLAPLAARVRRTWRRRGFGGRRSSLARSSACGRQRASTSAPRRLLPGTARTLFAHLHPRERASCLVPASPIPNASPASSRPLPLLPQGPCRSL